MIDFTVYETAEIVLSDFCTLLYVDMWTDPSDCGPVVINMSLLLLIWACGLCPQLVRRR